MDPKPVPIEQVRELPGSIGIPEEGSWWPRLPSGPKKPKKRRWPWRSTQPKQ
jgi:hypothetical protein